MFSSRYLLSQSLFFRSIRYLSIAQPTSSTHPHLMKEGEGLKLIFH